MTDPLDNTKFDIPFPVGSIVRWWNTNNPSYHGIKGTVVSYSEGTSRSDKTRKRYGLPPLRDIDWGGGNKSFFRQCINPTFSGFVSEETFQLWIEQSNEEDKDVEF